MATGETETKQGVETSANETSTSIENTPEFQKALSDHLAKAGREAKALDERERRNAERETKLQEREGELKRIEQEKELKEIESVINDPDSTDSEKTNARRAQTYAKRMLDEANNASKRLAEIRKEIAENEPMVKEIQNSKFLKQVKEFADENKIDPDELRRVVESKSLTNMESVKLVADLLPKSKPKDTPSTDSGKTIGGGQSFTREQIADREFYVRNKTAILKAQEEGRIK